MTAPPESHRCGAVSARQPDATAEKKTTVLTAVTHVTLPLQRKFNNKMHEKQP